MIFFRIQAFQAYLGHRNIQHTVRYTELSPMVSWRTGTKAKLKARFAAVRIRIADGPAADQG